jgi:glycine hydroxymethyltransferase
LDAQLGDPPMMDAILDLVEKHKQWREQNSLNLIPSENVMSPTVRQVLASDFGQRYTSSDNFYMGACFMDEMEHKGEELAKQVFGVETANLRPLSGHIADLTAIASFSKPNDTIMCVSAGDGGYPGIWKQGIPSFLQLKLVGFPFLREEMNIDVEKSVELIEKKKPRIVIFGASLILFPQPVKALAEVAHEVDAHVGYDGSHVMGLIAGKKFQDPIREGAQMLFGSTHKSFFGPQGGIILADREHGETIRKHIHPTFVDNAHWNRIAALTLALAEMKQFGTAYATQIVRNAQALAKALAEHSFPVRCSSLGFTKSHQVFLDYGGYKNGRVVAKKLEAANIITDCGVRLGVCELTRKGMKEKEMQTVAEFIKRVVTDREKPQKIKAEVSKFAADFGKIKYCFE